MPNILIVASFNRDALSTDYDYMLLYMQFIKFMSLAKIIQKTSEW